MNFPEAMAEHGLYPPEIIVDGKVHRFDGEKKGKRNGWYVFHGDHGAFGDWSTGLKKGWRDGNAKEITPEERKQQKAAQKQRQDDKKKTEAATAMIARQRWDKASPSFGAHPYLEKKGVMAHNIRLEGDKLLLPMKDDTGQIVNLQEIYPDGVKRFLKDGKITGCYFAFGKPKDDTIFIGEGYATCATAYEATGNAMVVAFSSTNLSAVTELMRRKYPKYNIKIIADNDQGKKNHNGSDYNPGLEAAIKASEHGADVVMPDFTPEEGKAKQTDLNDFAKTHTPEEVKEVMEKPIKRGVDYHSPLPHTRSEGRKPMATIENLEEICKRLGFTIRFNAITRKHELMRPGMEYISDEFDNAAYGRLVSECHRFNFPIGSLDHFIGEIAARNSYNPVVNWILKKPWDGISRKAEFFQTITSNNTELQNILMYRWMLQCIGAAFEPAGIAAEGVLVLQGEQYLGKTSWMMNLVPDSMQHVIKDSVILRLDEKDSVLQAIRYWICELGEMDSTFKKSEMAQLKAFLTSKKDTVRAPYGKVAGEYPRRTCFFGSVNPEDFLQDNTGNRRFWVIKCTAIEPFHNIDTQQVWAEMYNDYRQGARWQLTMSERAMLAKSNMDFEALDAVHEKILAFYEWDKMSLATQWMTATQVCEEVGIKTGQSELRKATALIKKMNGNKVTFKRWGDSQKPGNYLLMPPKATKSPMSGGANFPTHM